MDELYIPPCCISRKLPPLIEQGGLHSTFYSQGDWGLPKLWDSISLLVNGGRGAIFTALIVDDVDVFVLRYIRHYFDRGWTDALFLMTQSDRTDIVNNELRPYLDRVTYVPDRSEAIHSNLWIRSNGNQSLTIIGPIPISEEGNGHFCTYAASYEFPSDKSARQAILPFRYIAHINASIRGNHPLLKEWV